MAEYREIPERLLSNPVPGYEAGFNDMILGDLALYEVRMGRVRLHPPKAHITSSKDLKYVLDLIAATDEPLALAYLLGLSAKMEILGWAAIAPRAVVLLEPVSSIDSSADTVQRRLRVDAIRRCMMMGSIAYLVLLTERHVTPLDVYVWELFENECSLTFVDIASIIAGEIRSSIDMGFKEAPRR